MALDRLTKIDGSGISTTSDYRVGIVTASKFVGPFDGTGGNFSGIVTATGANFTGNVTIGGTLTYEDVTNIDSVGIITARDGIDCNGDLSVAGVTIFSDEVKIIDDKKLIVGSTDGDLTLKHFSGSNYSQIAAAPPLYIQSNDLQFRDYTNGDYYIRAVRDGSVELYHNNVKKFETTSSGVTVTGSATASTFTATNNVSAGGNISLTSDTGRLYLGASQDLHIFHNGSNSYIQDNGTGALLIGSGNSSGAGVYIRGRHGEESIIANSNGSVDLYYDNSKKFETTTNGIEITGKVQVLNNGATASSIDGTVDIRSVGGSALLVGSTNASGSLVKIDGASNGDGADGDYVRIWHSSNGICYFDNLHHSREITFRQRGTVERLKISSTGHIEIPADNAYLRIGASADLELFHDNNGDSYITNDTGHLTIRNNTSGKVINLQPKSGESGVIVRYEGAVELYHNNVKKIETTANGLKLPDSTRIDFGDSLDLKIYHHGGNSIIDTDTGDLILRSDADDVKILAEDGIVLRDNDDSTNFVNCINGGAVELYHNGTKKFETTSLGATVTGRLVSDGLDVGDSESIRFGTGYDMNINHSGSDAFYENSTGHTYFRNSSGTSGGLLFRSDGETHISNYAANEYRIKTFNQGGVELFYAAGTYSTPKIKTTATGVTVDGEVVTSQDYPDFRPALDLNFAQNQTLDPRITYSRVGSASVTDENGRLKFVGSHVPRFDHEPGTGKPRGLLIEAAGTNIMKSYSYFNNQNVPYATYFSNTNGASGELSTDILAPDGSNLTFKVHWPNGYSATHNGYARIGNTAADVGQLTAGDYAFSYFVKRGTDGAHNMDGLLVNEGGVGGLSFTAQQFTPYYAPSVNIRTDTNSDIIVEKYPDGWYRISNILFNATQSWTPHNTGVSHYVLAGVNYKAYYEAHAFYYWGMQLEKNPVSTSYIGMTVKEQTTRAADSAVIEGENFDEFFNHNGAENNDYQGTLIASVESAAASSPSAARYNKIQLEQNNDNKVQLSIVGGGTPYYDCHITYATATLADFTGSQGSTFPTVIKHGVAYAKNNAAYCYNGNTVETDNSVNVGGVSTATHGKYTQLTIGGQPTKAHIKRVMYYSQRISNTQLRNLTS